MKTLFLSLALSLSLSSLAKAADSCEATPSGLSSRVLQAALTFYDGSVDSAHVEKADQALQALHLRGDDGKELNDIYAIVNCGAVNEPASFNADSARRSVIRSLLSQEPIVQNPERPAGDDGAADGIFSPRDLSVRMIVAALTVDHARDRETAAKANRALADLHVEFKGKPLTNALVVMSVDYFAPTAINGDEIRRAILAELLK